jgi:hypothetical protein
MLLSYPVFTLITRNADRGLNVWNLWKVLTYKGPPAPKRTVYDLAVKYRPEYQSIKQAVVLPEVRAGP